MCLTKTSGEKIAQTDLITLKIMNVVENKKTTTKIYKGYFRSKFKYKFENVYKLDRKLSKKSDIVNIGYHSLAKNKKNKNIFINSDLRRRKVNNYAWDNDIYYHAAVLCVIPKGSTYYIGDKSDIVSDSIIIIEDISDKIFKTYKSNNNVIKEGFKYIENTYGKQQY